MINLSEELIKKLKENSDFIEYQAFILEKIEELNTTQGLEKMTNEKAGEEAKVREKARNKLYDILLPFLSYAQKNEPTAKEIGNAKKRFGL